MDERTKIKQKIVKLLTLANNIGATEKEALNAMEKASEMMAHYDIEMTELQIKNTKSVPRYFAPVPFMRQCLGDKTLVQISTLCDCLCRFTRKAPDNPGVLMYQVYGFPEDTEIVEYMFKVISTAMLNELAAYKNSDHYKNSLSHKVRLQNSFINGMEERIIIRVKQMIRDKNNIREKEVTGRSLVILKTDQVKDEYEKDMGYKHSYVTKRSSARKDYEAYGKGLEAGDKVSLNKGVTSAGLSAITSV